MFYSTTVLLFPFIFSYNLASAFLRNAADEGPLSTNYTTSVGQENITYFQIQPLDVMSSYWTIYFLSAENGHDYFAVGHCLRYNATMSSYKASLLDINDGVYAMNAAYDPKATFSTETFDFKMAGLHCYSSSPDLISTQTYVSTMEGVNFNLTSEAKGPNLYDAGVGTFNWGSGRTEANNYGLSRYEWGIPEGKVTGTITYNGTKLAIIPEKSMSYNDRQWGPGYTTTGWHLFVVNLVNGVKICAWINNPGDPMAPARMATIMYPDGHHEVHSVDPEISPTVPFVAPSTNLTYHGNFILNIPTKKTSLTVKLPVLAGEMTDKNDPNSRITLFEGYATFEGTFDGVKTTGWGVSEQKWANSQYPQ